MTFVLGFLCGVAAIVVAAMALTRRQPRAKARSWVRLENFRYTTFFDYGLKEPMTMADFSTEIPNMVAGTLRKTPLVGADHDSVEPGQYTIYVEMNLRFVKREGPDGPSE